MKHRLPVYLLLMFVSLAPAVALAHAFPQRSEPRVGATLDRAPPMARIWFNSYLEPLFNKLVVKDAAGKDVSVGKARVDPHDRALLEVKLAPLVAGKYHVYWHVTSKDGHQTEGDFTFTIKGR